uniref:Caldesmon 1b n=1 Tax=Cyprinus carpio TaxID=7962 RepID=A0A8C1GE77_CYPCA
MRVFTYMSVSHCVYRMNSHDDDEEAARERRRRARQERLRNMENEESNNTPTETNSSAPAEDDEQALLERIAKREEWRQKRMKEALERQKELDPTIMDETEREEKNEEEKIEESNVEVEEAITKKEDPVPVTAAEEPKESPEKTEEPEEEDRSQRSYLREQVISSKFFAVIPSYDESLVYIFSLRFSPTSLRSPDTEKQDPIAKLEAERKLQELKRRRNETDSEVLEKMKQKQQTAEAELEELKKKREERRKILEEEEKQKKQQLAEKKAKEEVEKEKRKKMKEEIERRRAEAAEKKKQKEESKEGSKAPFIAPKGASAKYWGLACTEFILLFIYTSPVKTSHTPLVCKIGNRLEQYTSAVQVRNLTKSPKSPVDVPVAESLRSIKSMWEKGNVVNPTPSPASPPPVTKVQEKRLEKRFLVQNY